MENMNDHVKIVQTYPDGRLHTFHVIWIGICLLFEAIFHVVRNGLDLSGGVSLTNDEVVGWCVIQGSEIQFNNSLAFDFLDAIDDQFDERFGRYIFCLYFYL